jgi:ABC-type glycerol-3-phosphate transport system substrate-binding protein
MTKSHMMGRKPAKVFLLTASLATAAALLVGCSTPASAPAQKDASGPVTLQTWGAVTSIQSQFKAYKSAFPTQSKGQSLKVVSAGASDSDSIAKYRLELSSGKNIPDIMELNYSELPEFAESGVLADLSGALKPYLGNVTKAAQALSVYKGKTVAVPLQVNEKLWFYRTDLFKAAGIDPTTVKSQADFIAAGKKLQASSPSSFMWNIGPNPQQYQWGEIVSGNGAAYSTQSPTCKIIVGSNAGVSKAFTAMKTLRTSGVVDSAVDDFTPGWQSGLADNTIASTLGASWLPVFLEQYAPKLSGKWGVTTWPEIGGAANGAGSEAGGAIYVISAASKHKAAAEAFITNLLLTKKGVDAYHKVNSTYIPNVTAALNEAALQNDPYFGTSLIKAYLAASKTYKVFPFDPASNAETTALSSSLANYLASSAASPSSALKTAQDQLTSQVGCPYSK